MLPKLSNSILKFSNGFIDVRALRNQLFQLFFAFLQREGQLARQLAFWRVHIQHLLDVLKAEPETASPQDYLQASPVFSRINARCAIPLRIYESFVLIETDCAGRYTKLLGKFRNGELDPIVLVNFCAGVNP